MNEARIAQYLDLIQRLLSCSGGEQRAILQGQGELWDEESLRTLQREAGQLRGMGRESEAGLLEILAGQLVVVLGDGKNKGQDYLSFLMQVLQTVSDSCGNPQAVYPLLVKNIDKLNDEFLRTLQSWGKETLQAVEPEEARDIGGVIGEFANLIQQFPLSISSRASNLEIAITGYELLLIVFPRESQAEQWAMTQNNLASAYCDRIKGDRAENLEQAIKCYQNALTVRTCDAFPEQWAITQNNLATAYGDRIREDRAENLEQAIKCYQNALIIYTRLSFPEQWAMTQNNLATAYGDRIREDRAENLEQAIKCYQNALIIYTRLSFPKQWAMTQNNLATAYDNRIDGERADNLEIAIDHYNLALEIKTCEDFPEDWAMTQNNLAIAYKNRIRGSRDENLEQAITFFKEGLTVFTFEHFPEKWATTQNNLAIAYKNRIKGERTYNLEQSISFFEAALTVYTHDGFQEKWAMIKNNLANVYLYRIKGLRDENLEQAIELYKAALTVRTRTAFPEKWAETKNNLGAAYHQRIKGEKAKNLKQAIRVYENALTIRTRQAFPLNHVTTLWNLGRLYQMDQQWQKAHDTYEPAIKTIDFLRGEIQSGDETKQKLAEQWNRLYRSMVEVCIELAATEPNYYAKAIEYAERSKARNLVELLANKDIYPKLDLYRNSELHQTHCHQLEQQRRQISAKQRELDILISSRESEEKNQDKIDKQRQELSQLQQQRDELLAEINQIDSRFTFTQEVKPILFREMQSLIDENTAIVEWYISYDQIFTFIITHHYSYPIVFASHDKDIKDLRNWDENYRDSYQQQNIQWINNLDSQLQNLAEILRIDAMISLIDERFAQKGAKCSRLILIPHRYLHLFPLHALPLADGKLLFEHFPQGVGYAPSCQLLKLAKDQEQHRPEFTRLFAIQNPTRQPARPLLGSQLEINKIHQHFDAQHSTILKEAAATEANLYQRMAQMRSSHCLHFSCHGEFNHESPLESALLLANPDGTLGEKESKLTLGEVFEKLYLNQCRLVTFSACESGMTDPNSLSDEYIGLPSGFLFAGSPSVVSTLWSVDPIATTLIMIKFYQNLHRLPHIKTGDVAIALNKAQQWLRTLTHKKWARIQNHPQFQHLIDRAFKNSPKRDRNKFKDSLAAGLHPNRQPQPFANPYYWSAFVAIGI